VIPRSDDALFGWLTPIENVRVRAQECGGRWIDGRAERPPRGFIALVGAAADRDPKFPHELSGGSGSASKIGRGAPANYPRSC
jgi:ABC-type nitrate/sulfonate/bicarbonate transport system ATPase subunit